MAADRNEEPSSMRARIKALALDLLIQHGYRGVSFGDIAESLAITRANIHYHFGNKQALVEEVLDDYVAATTAALRELWARPGEALAEKLTIMIGYSRKRYQRYNAKGQSGRPWSLIARMRQDGDALSPRCHEILQRFEKDLNAIITAAIEQAKRRNEYAGWMPVGDVAVLLVSIANSASPITQDAGSFDRLEKLYMAFARIVEHAFAADRPVPVERVARRRPR